MSLASTFGFADEQEDAPCNTGVTYEDGGCASTATIDHSTPPPPSGGTPTVSSSETTEETLTTAKRGGWRNRNMEEVPLRELPITEVNSAREMEEIRVVAQPDSCPAGRLNSSAGNPTSTLDGGKELFERDYFSLDALPISIERKFYARLNDSVGLFGRGWTVGFLGGFRIEGQDAEGYSAVFLKDSISSYAFRVNFSTKHVTGLEYYINDARLHYEGGDWYLTHSDGRQSRFGTSIWSSEIVLLNTTDTNGSYLSYVYGSYRNLPVEVRHSAGYTVQLRYQYFGADSVISKIIDPYGEEWVYQYDSARRLTSAYDPLGYRDRYQYDSNHNLTGVYSKKGDLIGQWTYDSQGRTLTSSKFDGSHLVTFSYTTSVTGEYRYVDVVDEFGRETRYSSGVYNGRDFLLQVDSESNDCPQSNINLDYYEATGYQMFVEDAAGLRTEYQYDEFDRPIELTVSDESGSAFANKTLTRELSYAGSSAFVVSDKMRFDGDLVREINTDICLSANSGCRLGLVTRIEEVDLIAGDASLVTTFSYQKTDELVTSATMNRGGMSSQINYSPITGRATQFYQGGRLVREITGYTVDGRISSQRIPGLYTEYFSYNERGELTSYSKSTGSETLAASYTYDQDGLLTGVESDEGIAKVGTEYFYNENGQATQERHTAPLPPPPPPPPTCNFPCFNEL